MNDIVVVKVFKTTTQLAYQTSSLVLGDTLEYIKFGTVEMGEMRNGQDN